MTTERAPNRTFAQIVLGLAIVVWAIAVLGMPAIAHHRATSVVATVLGVIAVRCLVRGRDGSVPSAALAGAATIVLAILVAVDAPDAAVGAGLLVVIGVGILVAIPQIGAYGAWRARLPIARLR